MGGIPIAPFSASPFLALMNFPVSFPDIQQAAERLNGVVKQTPVLDSRQLNRCIGGEVFLKAENLQRTGAFKFRGAWNALSQVGPETRTRGVLAWSSGNHAQALALAGSQLGVPVTIVMPEDAPEIKRQATEGYGAEIIPYDKHKTTREELGQRIARERGLAIIPPYDHPHIIAGQGTAAMELLRETGPLDALFVPVGGGGLISGSAIAAKALAPGCRVIGVEPAAGDDATRSFQSGELHSVHNPDTIADGARTPSLGVYTWPLVRSFVDEMMTVEEGELARAMFFLWERMKTVIEPTGALGVAGLFRRAGEFEGKRVGVILSGGNVDPRRVPELLGLAGRPLA